MSRPSVCLSYLHAPGTWSDAYLPLSLEVMKDYDWITQISILNSNGIGDSHVNGGKIRQDYQNFGYGHETQPEDGGIDAVTARNYQLSCAMQGDCDWVLMCDTDEWFDYDLIKVIEDQHRSVRNIVWLEQFHMVSPTMHMHNKNHPRTDVMGMSVNMFDPHSRIVRNGCGARFVPNINEEFRDKQLNRTSHCVLDVPDAYRNGFAEGPYHYHMRYLLDPKRGHDWASAALPVNMLRSKLEDAKIPAAVLATYQEQQVRRYGTEQTA